MGWKGYESTISFGMLFKKMFCHKCGQKLKVKRISNIYKKGESNYSDDILGHPTIGMDKVEKSCYVYHCPNCNSEITYDAQCIIAKKQKHFKRKILYKDE